MKKLISIILSAMLMLSFSAVAFAEGTTARLYNVYGDGMLFQQNKDAIFAGTAKAGSEITAELFSADGTLEATGTAFTKSDGTFEVSFVSPAGGYNEYSVVLSENSTEFANLKNVVFGELWLASGQSNMQYPLAQSRTGRDMYANGQKLSKWLRVFCVPSYPGNTLAPEFTYAEPQKDIEGAVWTNGENIYFYNISAVAYFFAADLMEKLDMPVGILNASLGGSAIASWLSRDAIDNDVAVKNDLVANGDYVDFSEWNSAEQNIYDDMAANYNHKIGALGNFRPSGMIWYQGESDIGRSADRYARAFDLMQRSYSEHFGYENELMPIIYSQLASYVYSDDMLAVAKRNTVFSDIQKARPESRATVTIYDIPLTYIPEAGAIHPECKEEIGQRMAISAANLVYGGSGSYTAPTVKTSQIRDGSIYVTFENTGDGLVSVGEELYGFAICGDNGVYVQAQAEIVSADTVRIYSDYVKNPRSASYAYSLSNMRSNLYSSENGKPAFPAEIFITDDTVSTHYWYDKQWTDCNEAEIWHVTNNDKHIKFYDSWVADNADITYSDGALNIKSNRSSFSINPILTFKDGILTKPFHDTDTDYSDYGEMSFYLRNNGNADLKLSRITVTANSVFRYSPEVYGTRDTEAVIPADGEWHLVTVDLNRLYLSGNECGVSYPCNRLKNVSDIRFEFSSDGESNLSIDEIRFAPSDEKAGLRFDADSSKADNFLEKISAFFVNLIGSFISLFK